MRLSPANFDRFLGANGDVSQQLGWRKATACPCFNPASGAAKPSCTVCGGKGQIWGAEVVDWAGMTNMNQKRGFAMFGTWEPGDSLLTIPGQAAFYDAGQYDRFRALNSTHRFSTNLTRGQNDNLKGTVVIDCDGNPQIQRVIWLTPDGTGIITGDGPAVGAGGVMTWADDLVGPPDGTQYSVTYDRFDEFFVYQDLPSNRNSGVDGLPKKLQVRTFDLFGR